jgi:hypothetical protein
MRTHLISGKKSVSGRITKAVRCHVLIGLMCLLLQNDIHADDTITRYVPDTDKEQQLARIASCMRLSHDPQN